MPDYPVELRDARRYPIDEFPFFNRHRAGRSKPIQLDPRVLRFRAGDD
jgi:hypothetical protein